MRRLVVSLLHLLLIFVSSGVLRAQVDHHPVRKNDSASLTYKLTDTDCKVVKYRWETDADTSLIADSDVSPQLVKNPTEAAEISHQHGQHLGDLLTPNYPNLRKIHLIRHSAGSWAAPGAIQYLRAQSSNVVTQLTLLDPLTPNSTETAANRSLGTAVTNQLDYLFGAPRPQQNGGSENYYASYVTSASAIGAIGAQETFSRGIGDMDSQPDAANFAAATAVAQAFAVTSGTPQTITFNALPNRVVGAKFVLAASTTSGLPVSFSVASGPATLGADGQTVIVGSTAGTVTIRATQPGGVRDGVTYEAASAVDQTFEVALGPPTRAQKITFPKPASPTYGQEPITLVATADSGLPVSFTLVSGPASLDGSQLAFTGAGNAVIRANQAGDAIYKPASAVTQTIVVKKAPLSVTFTSVTRLVGQANPNFSPDYSGFVGLDTAADLAANRPRGTTKATSASPAGTYPITVTGGLDTRYTFVAGAPANLTIIGYGGDYEALLLDANQRPLGLLTLKVSANALTYTGTIALAAEANPVALRGSLSPASDLTTATHTFTRAATSALPALSVTYTVAATTTTGVAVTGSVTRGGVKLGDFAQGVRLGAPPAPLGNAAYTLVLSAPNGLGNPAGFGYATGSIAASTGLLKLTGRLGDGTPFTDALRTAPDRTYRLWLNPYAKRIESYLGGSLNLRPHPASSRFPGLYHVPAEDSRLWWSKAASAKDATYRAGIGPVELIALLDPWLPPHTQAIRLNNVFVPAANLAQRLGLSGSPAPLGLDHGAIDGTAASRLPLTATLNGTLVTATNPADTLWRMAPVAITSGAFSGSFRLVDTVIITPATGTRPAVTKTVTRNVSFMGVLRQRPNHASVNDRIIGAAQLLITPADGNATTAKTSVSLELLAP